MLLFMISMSLVRLIMKVNKMHRNIPKIFSLFLPDIFGMLRC